MPTILTGVPMDPEDLREFSELRKKSTYVVAPWVFSKAIPLNLYKQIDPAMKFITGNPTVKQKMNSKTGSLFLKVVVPLGEGCYEEFDVSYRNDDDDYDYKVKEGDVIDKDTIEICIETKMGNKHMYLRGKTVKE
jgi:hypothetical protein